MDDRFKIYVDRLVNGSIEVLDETFPPDVMDISEGDLTFPSPIKVSGKAYLSNNTLILNLSILTDALLPCAICNESVTYKIDLHDRYFSEDLDSIRSGIFNYKDLLRETILLEIPQTIECHEGACPERKTLAKYLKQDSKKDDSDSTYHPFADL